MQNVHSNNWDQIEQLNAQSHSDHLPVGNFDPKILHAYHPNLTKKRIWFLVSEEILITFILIVYRLYSYEMKHLQHSIAMDYPNHILVHKVVSINVRRGKLIYVYENQSNDTFVHHVLLTFSGSASCV